MSQPRNQPPSASALKQRQQGFLQGLASLMAKRNTPLPPSLTGIPYSNYDPSNTLWSIIEPSPEIGSFRLAGRDVDLFKLWGLVFQQGGGHTVNGNNAWGSILPNFDLPDEFPQVQANGSTSVALMLSQYYMAILFPFEEVYRKNLQEQRGKISIPRTQSTPHPPEPSQPSRRKIEYVPLAREADSYGGRDLKVIDAEWATIPLRRIRDINEWGTVDIETLAMSLRSRLAIEMAYALTTITVLSTMRGQTPGSGFPIYQCGDLFDELLDLMEELAFGEPEESLESTDTDYSPNIITNRELVGRIHEAEIRPFAPLEPRQGSKAFDLGPKQRPGITIMAIVNIVRNLSIIPDNHDFLSNHPRLIDMMLRLCTLRVDDDRGPLPASEHLSLSDLLTIRKDILYTLSSISGLINLSRHTSFHRLGLRIFDLMASYLVDPTDAVSPLASVQIAGVVPSANLKPPALADVALEVFTRFSQSDSNRQVIANIVPSSSLWLLLTRLVHRLPIVDADFVLMQREYWLSFVEKIVMAIYSLVFLAPPDLKQKIRTDRTLAFKSVMLRMVHKAVMTPSHDGRSMTIVSAKRAVEAMKVLDSTEDVFQQSAEATMPILSFGMGFAEAGDIGLEKGTGILGGKGDVAWEMMMLREVFQDERMFNELDSLVRVEY